MRNRTLLCSTSAAILGLSLSPAWGQAIQNHTAGGSQSAENEIVVTGLRYSLRSAQHIKRNSDQILDAIVAEDIGKFPDVSASAALARVTGVQVNRAAGEASQVQIRGLPDISTTYNGREIFTAENRSVAIQDFPAGAVAALEVYKSSTSNLIEPGIGGQVNVRSRRPFDFDGLEISGSLSGLLFEQSQSYDWNGNLLVSNRWDTGIGEIGALVNVAMTNINFLDSTRENDRFMDRTPDGLVRPNGQGLFYSRGDRWRPSVNAALQWRPSPEIEVYIDGLFQGYRGHDSNHWLFVPTFGDTRYSNVVLREDGRTIRSATIADAAIPDGYDEFHDARTDTYQVAGGIVYHPGRLKIAADLAYTESTYREKQANIDYALTRSPVRDVNFDIGRGAGGGTFDFLDFNAADPANYLLRGLYDRVHEGSGDDVQARIDLEYETDSAWLSAIQVGARFNDRNALRRSGNRYAGLLHLGMGYSDLPVTIAQIRRGFRYDDHQPETQFVGATFESVFDNLDALRAIAGFPAGSPGFNPLEAFDANEKAYAVYGQIKYAFNAGIPVDGMIGIRAVKTKTAISGTLRDLTSGAEAFNPVAETNTYTDYLPNFSARLELTPELQLRLAYTETRTRPNFDQLNPSTAIDPLPGICVADPAVPGSGPDNVNCIQTSTGGNPHLAPLESKNYDVSLEYYFSDSGSLTLAAFRRDTSNFIFRSAVDVAIPNAPDLRTSTPKNGGDGRMQGIEVAFTSFLDFDALPDWARGFGVHANYTYIDAATELSPEFRTRLPGKQPVPFVSKHAFNLVGMYERGPVSARLAYNYRSRFVTEYQDIQGFLSPLYQKPLGTLDFSTSISPTENLTFIFDVQNILGQPIKTYRAYNEAGDTYDFQRKYLERVYSVGVRFRF